MEEKEGKKREERGEKENEKKREWMEQKWETNAVHKATSLENDVEGRKSIFFSLSLSEFFLFFLPFSHPFFCTLEETRIFFKCFMFLFKHGTKRIQVRRECRKS